MEGTSRFAQAAHRCTMNAPAPAYPWSAPGMAFPRCCRAALSSFSKWRPLGWASEDAVGQRQDRTGGAVVGLDLVDPRARVPVGESKGVLEVGAPPRVNALGVVADRHDRWWAPIRSTISAWSRLVSWYSSTRTCRKRSWNQARWAGEPRMQVQPELQQIIVIKDVRPPASRHRPLRTPGIRAARPSCWGKGRAIVSSSDVAGVRGRGRSSRAAAGAADASCP